MKLVETHGADSATATNELRERAKAVAAVAATHAVAVDRNCRFPEEAFSAAKQQRLMGIFVPTSFGGEGAKLSEVVEACFILARACGSTGMIFAMHQIMVACLVRHTRGSSWHSGLL